MTRPEAYADEHRRSRHRDRRTPPGTLRALLGWATRAYQLETPDLNHSHRDVGDDGTPAMRQEARRWLGLAGHDQHKDDWRRIACRTDPDGRYITPLRCAIERTPRADVRAFLRDLAASEFATAEVAARHGLTEMATTYVVHGTLIGLWRRYSEAPIPRRAWIDLSDSQRAAVVDGERMMEPAHRP